MNICSPCSRALIFAGLFLDKVVVKSPSDSQTKTRNWFSSCKTSKVDAVNLASKTAFFIPSDEYYAFDVLLKLNVTFVLKLGKLLCFIYHC